MSRKEEERSKMNEGEKREKGKKEEKKSLTDWLTAESISIS